MRGRRLVACTLMVTTAHAALIVAWAQGSVKAIPPGASPERPAFSLTLLGPERVARPALSPVESSRPRAVARRPRKLRGNGAEPSDTSRTDLPVPTAYRSPSELDGPVRARSAPDLSMLADLPWSGLPLRLRLFIDREGRVVDTQVLQSSEADEVTSLVRQMFQATGFTPGLMHAEPVPSYKDVEIALGSP